MKIDDTTIKQAKVLERGDVLARGIRRGHMVEKVESVMSGRDVAVKFSDGGMIVVHRDYAFVVAA